jgi:4-amino-4-deoxy-L-arabinose transferase-like glycosyltransferase
VLWEIVTWRRKPSRGAAWWIGHLVGIAIFALLMVPWLLLVMRELPEAMKIWKYELEAQEKPREAYYYLLTIWQLALLWTIPWAIGIVMTFIHGKRGMFSPRGRRRVFVVAWLVIVVGVFSLNGVKKNAYLLPIMPAVVLLAADVVSMILVTARRKNREDLAGIAMIAQVLIGVGFALSVVALAVKNHFGASAIGACVVVLILTILPLRAILAKRPRQWMFLQATAYVAVLVVFIGLYIAALDNSRSPRVFAGEALKVSREMNVPIWRAQSPEEVSVYLPMDLPDGSLSPRVLIALDDPKHEFVPSSITFEKSLYGIKVIDFREIDLPVHVTKRRYRLFDVTLDRGAGKLALVR